MSDLFSMSAAATISDESAGQDHEYRAWAERVIREVNEEVSGAERKAKDFVQAWVRWTDLTSFLSYAELVMMKRSSFDSNELQWHETLASGLISLGGLIREWAKNFDKETLDLIGYEGAELETRVNTIRESLQDWHMQAPTRRISEMQDILSRHLK